MAAFIFASLLQAQTPTQKFAIQLLYQGRWFSSPFGVFWNASWLGKKNRPWRKILARQADIWRCWLLIMAGDVELNPGPLNFTSVKQEVLDAALKILKDGDDSFEMPGTKADTEKVLNLENENAKKFVINTLLKPAPTAPPPQPNPTGNNAQNTSKPATSSESDDNPGKTVKLPEFFGSDTREWFKQVEQMLLGQAPTVKKTTFCAFCQRMLFGIARSM